MGKKKELIGTVITDKMQKTIIVRIMYRTKHPKYGRIIKRYNKFKVHDEKNSAKIGDIVKIVATRPLSKEKNFRLVQIIKKAEMPQIELKDEPK
jgi:small subunit ribosomal protein S17